MWYALIYVRTEESDYLDITDQIYHWSYSEFGNVRDLIPTDILSRYLANYVTLSQYVEANAMHDVTPGKSIAGIAGILHLIVHKHQ